MLTKRYMTSVKNVPAIMEKIIEGTAPTKFSAEHLKSLGFVTSSDRSIIPVLKDLGFLGADGTPTQRYHNYRNPARSEMILGEALKEAYEDLFHINAYPTDSDRAAIEGKFRSTHNVKERVAQQMAMTFFAFLKLADISHSPTEIPIEKKEQKSKSELSKPKSETPKLDIPYSINESRTLHLRYNIEVHLPATKDIEVYNAIFKSLKENLLD